MDVAGWSTSDNIKKKGRQSWERKKECLISTHTRPLILLTLQGAMNLNWDGSDTDTMIESWDDHVEDVGLAQALQHFWRWQATLPRKDQSDVDPSGSPYSPKEVLGWTDAEMAAVDDEHEQLKAEKADGALLQQAGGVWQPGR